MAVSIIVPVRNEGESLAPFLQSLSALLAKEDELIVVDGESDDDSATLARRFTDRVLSCPPGRARQMNRGAQQATGEWLWFLHADSAGLTRQLALIRALPAGAQWGRFDVRLSGERLLFRVIGTLINWRSRLTGVATGDQGLFIRRRLFEESGGYPDQPLMEDVALTARLKRHDRPVCLAPAIITSSRRWEAHGVWRTIWLMWSLRWRYWRGADPVILHRDYYGHG